MQEYGHTLFETLLKDEENQYCFDCGKKPAHWASINNAIYLCLNCASNHRSFGVNISYVRSITIDSWNDNQLRFMASGGNRRLAELLEGYSIGRSYAKDILYNSVLLDYYRKLLKSEVNNQNPPFPPHVSDCLKSTISNQNLNNEYFINTTNDTNKFSSVSSSGSSLNDNVNQNFSYNTSKYQSRDNSSRYSSVGSNDNFADKYSEKPSGYLDSFKYYLGSALYKTMDVAYNIKERVSEMDISSTLKTTGLKTVEIIKDTGIKVKDSNAIQTVAQKASEGYNFLSAKIFGKKKESKDDSQISSSNYKPKSQERDDEYYIKLDEENRKNNYFSNPDPSQRFYSRGSNN